MKNITNEEKVKWLKDNCSIIHPGNWDGPVDNTVIDLSNLDFGDMDLNLSGVKARSINNSDQEANVIYNSSMKATDIYNDYQTATDTILNYNQEAEKTIANVCQTAGKVITNEYQNIVPNLAHVTKTKEEENNGK